MLGPEVNVRRGGDQPAEDEIVHDLRRCSQLIVNGLRTQGPGSCEVVIGSQQLGGTMLADERRDVASCTRLPYDHPAVPDHPRNGEGWASLLTFEDPGWGGGRILTPGIASERRSIVMIVAFRRRPRFGTSIWHQRRNGILDRAHPGRLYAITGPGASCFRSSATQLPAAAAVGPPTLTSVGATVFWVRSERRRDRGTSRLKETALTYPSLPHVTVIAPTEDQVRRRDWTEETVRWILSNLVYAGIGPVRDRYVSYQQWIDGAVKLMAEDGTVQFLVNMIHTLRQTFGTVAPNRPPADSIVAVQPTEAVYDPTLVGIGNTPPVLTDAAWIHNAARLIDRQGARYFLERALRALRTKVGGLPE